MSIRRTIETWVERFNETDAAVTAALDGVGLAYCLQWRVKRELAEGLLVDVLPGHAVDGPPMVMYYPSRRQTHPGLKRLVDMLRGEQDRG